MHGLRGEKIAADYLQKQGYIILAKNFRVPGGEIDLICSESKTLVCVEVKTRKFGYTGGGIEAITKRKVWSLVHTFNIFCQKHSIPDTHPRRIDIVLVVGTDSRATVTHLIDCISLDQELPAKY